MQSIAWVDLGEGRSFGGGRGGLSFGGGGGARASVAPAVPDTAGEAARGLVVIGEMDSYLVGPVIVSRAEILEGGRGKKEAAGADNGEDRS